MLVMNDMTADARVDREARSLAGAGHSVEVLALRGRHLPACEDAGPYTVHRVADFTHSTLREPVAKLRERRARERAIGAHALSMAPDVVHCHDTNTLGIGTAVAQRLGIPYVYDAHELYPDSLMQRPFQGSAPVQAYLRHQERRLVPGAAAVITVSDGLSRVLCERYGVAPVVVANCPETRQIADRGMLKQELGLPRSSIVVLYQGGLQLGRAIDELVDAMARVPGAYLVVQGSGEYESAMRSRVAERGMDARTIFMGQVPHERLFELTCGADIGTVFLEGVTLNHQLAWTNRMFMYMMAGIPTAATDLPGASGVLLPAGAGLVAPAGDVSVIADVLGRLAGDREMRQRLGAAARAAAEHEYNWGVQEHRLLGVYEGLGA